MPRSHARHAALVLSLAALAATGCGSSNKPSAKAPSQTPATPTTSGTSTTGTSPASGSDVAQVKAAWHTYVTALGSGNGAAVCAAMTPALATQFAHAVSSSAGGSSLAGKSCGQIMQFVLTQGASQIRTALDALSKSEPADIKVNGNSASFTVHASIQGHALNIPGKAQKQGGTWKISCCVGPGGG